MSLWMIPCGFFTFKFEGHTNKWCHTLHVASIHCFDHMFRELCLTFILYDRKPLNQKILKLPNHLTNLFKVFTIIFFIILMNFLKMKLTQNYWIKYFSILFTFLRIHMSYNISNLSQHTLVLELLNLRWKRLLSQLTI